MTDPWTRIDRYHWRHLTGRYYIERSRAPDGWVFLAWHKRPRATGEKGEPVATCISPERRLSFEAAAADCAAHYKQQQRQRAA